MGEFDYDSQRLKILVKDIPDKVFEAQMPLFFGTKEEIEAQDQTEFEGWKQDIMNMPKQELIDKLFREWLGEDGREQREIEVMKVKFELEFGLQPQV